MSSFSTLSEHIDSAPSLLREASTEWIHVDHKDGLSWLQVKTSFLISIRSAVCLDEK